MRSERAREGADGGAAKLLQPLLTAPVGLEEDAKVEVVLLVRSKDEEHNKGLFKQVLEGIGSGVSTTRVAVVRVMGRNGGEGWMGADGAESEDGRIWSGE